MCVKLPSENLNPDSHISQTLIFAKSARWDAKDSIVKLFALYNFNQKAL